MVCSEGSSVDAASNVLMLVLDEFSFVAHESVFCVCSMVETFFHKRYHLKFLLNVKRLDVQKGVFINLFSLQQGNTCY